MRGLFIEVQSCYRADANANEVSDELMATGIIYQCLYQDLRLNGPANVRLGTMCDPSDATTTHLHVQVLLGITGMDERNLPSVEAVTQSVARYVTLALCDVVQQVEAVRVNYAPLAGIWEVYDMPLTREMLAVAEAPLSA